MSVFDEKEAKIVALIFFGPVILVTLPIWLPTFLAVKLFQIMWAWVE